MKKPNLFNSVAATAACVITSILNAALPPSSQWEQEALTAYWIGTHKGLNVYEIADIQKQLQLLSSIPLKIINNEVLSFQPRNRRQDAIEVALQGAQTGVLISTTRFHTHSDAAFTNPFEIVSEQKILNAPPIPLIVNIYHVPNYNDAAQRAQQKKQIGSFMLSGGELAGVEAIVISLNYSEIRYKNGNRISGINIFPQLHRE